MSKNIKQKFGTFQGVFTPSILTILGVIMYLRFGWVLGNVGLIETILIVNIATLVTLLTGLSVSALSTNMKVKGGGAYYIISRSLGIETGAAIGIWLYLTQAISISFYITGFSEYLHHVYPFLNEKLISVFALIILAIIAIKSVNFALKTQFLILTMIILSLISFFMGSASKIEQLPSAIHITKEHFWIVFAVFFPAVTGILSGIGMSGDLKNPAKSLPLGTLGAILISYLVYMAIPFFLIHIIKDNKILISNPYIMENIAIKKEFIFAGILGATLSSALGALLSAPRTLQALAKDRIMPRFLNRESAKSKIPQIATAFSFLIALLFIFLGDLNFIAPILTMFTLTTYGLLNFAACIETLIGTPSWRPTFQVNWLISLIGTVLCFAVMFMINPGATFIALIISIITFYIMKKRDIQSNWGDTRYGIYNLLAKFSILNLDKKIMHEKNWIPNIIVFSGSPTKRWHLIETAYSFSHGKGLLTVATILLKSTQHTFERLNEMHNSIKDYTTKREIEAIVKISTSKDIYDGITSLIKAYGFGPISPNTIVLGKSQNKENYHNFIKVIKEAYDFNKNIVIISETEHPDEKESEDRIIDIWWNQKSNNANLGIALAYMLNTSDNWKDSELFIRTIISKEDNLEESQNRLEEFIKQGRFNATSYIHTLENNQSPFDIIQQKSQNSDFVFLGLRSPVEDESLEEYGEYYYSLMDQTKSLPNTAFVLAAENIDFKNIFYD